MKLLTLLGAVLIGLLVESAFATYNHGSSDIPNTWEFNGCKLKKPYYSSEWNVKYWKIDNMNDDHWQYEKLWKYVQYYWRANRKYLEKYRIFTFQDSGCEDKKERVCQVCDGASSIANCIKYGHQERCMPGQDACILEKIDSKYYRRCGHLCDCTPNYVATSFKGKGFIDKVNCHRAGCTDKLYGCAAGGCNLNQGLLVDPRDRNKPAAVGAFEKDGTPCRCDAMCNMMSADDPRPCCRDACNVCMHGCGGGGD